MSAVQALEAVPDAGLHLGIDGDDLMLEASIAPSAALLSGAARRLTETDVAPTASPAAAPP